VTLTEARRPARHAARAPRRESGGTNRLLTGGLLIAGLCVALVVLSVVAAASGQLSIPPSEVASGFLRGLGLDMGPAESHPRADATLWSVRFPRVAMAIVVGAALAVAGALMQGAFGNPLAEPSVVGRVVSASTPGA